MLTSENFYVGPPEHVFFVVDTLIGDELELDPEEEGYTPDWEEEATCELVHSLIDIL